jgi:hypothetical protein
MTRGPVATTRVTALLAALLLASVTLTVNDELPTVVGVPDSTPVLVSRVSPDGRLPAEMDQTRGFVPPLAVKVVL